MAGKNIHTVITIGGAVDSTFGKIGSALTAVGSQINGLSQKVISFGEDSVNLYADYEDNLLSIQAKLGDASKRDMSTLDESMRHWAANTRYTATQVSEATKGAAASGWELTEIMTGMPTVLNVAAAADMDLADAMSYANSMLAGLNVGFDDLEKLGDQWIKTANTSRASAEDLGESFETLGSLATFADSSEELFTMLSVMSRFGTKGSEAGTLLRNVMLRMITPTNKAAKALAELGYTEEEVAEAVGDSDIDIGGAAEQMEKLGISAFDSKGKLLPITKIISNIRKSVKGMTEKEMYDVLGKIFPTRTIRGIMDLLRASDEEYQEITDSIVESTGYAAYAASVQESGLGGSLRLLNSRWEEVQLTVGEKLAPTVEQAAGWLSDLAGSVNDMTDKDISGVVGALTGIAAVGPGLMVAGAGLRLMSSTVGQLALLGLVAAGVVGYLAAINDASFTETFGTMEADIEGLKPYLSGLVEDVSSAHSDVTEFNTLVSSAAESYANAQTTLSSSLLTNVLTNSTLTEADKTKLEGLGGDMVDAVKTGITARTASALEELDLLYQGDTNNDTFKLAEAVLTGYYDTAIAATEQKSQELRNAMTAAFEDGHITSEERANIVSIQKELSDAMMMTTNADMYAGLNKLIAGGDTLSRDGYEAYKAEIEAARSDALKVAEDSFFSNLGWTQAALESMIGQELTGTGTQWDGQIITKEIIDSVMADMRSHYDDYIKQAMKPYDEMLNEVDRSIIGTAAESAGAIIDVLHGDLGTDTAKGAAAQSLIGRAADEDVLWELASQMPGSGANFEISAAFQEALDESESAIAQSINDYTDEIAAMYDTRKILEDMGYGAFVANHGMMNPRAIEYAAAAMLRSGAVENPEAYLQGWQGPPLPGPNDTAILPDGKKEADTFLQKAIAEFQSRPLHVPVTLTAEYGAGVSGLSGSGGGGAKTTFNMVNGLSYHKYAEGGRATEASIFGEAGAEWAIPEEHTDRTAQLLESAARASGFSWPEILRRTGGLNSNPSFVPAQIVYSPTIIANNAEGVAEKLAEDKERLERWWRETQEKEARTSYA